MARRRSTSIAAAISAILLPLTADGCADDNVSLRIECSVVPTAAGDACSYGADSDCVLDGVLNVRAADHYTAALRITNALSERASDNPLRPEPNGISLKTFEVEVDDSAGKRIGFPGLPNPFTVTTSGFIPPGATGVAPAELLPGAYVKVLAKQEASADKLGQVIVTVVAHGETQGGVDVETGTWQWPVRLISVDPTNPNQCRAAMDTICTFGQDLYAYSCVPTAE